MSKHSKSTRQPRRTPEELRALILQAGVDLLAQNGLGSGTENVTFKIIFDYLRETQNVTIHYASVMGRVWRDQKAFQEDLAATIAKMTLNGEEVTRTLDAMTRVLKKANRETLAGRWRAINRLCLKVGETSLEDLVDSSQWPIWVGIWATARSSTRDPSNIIQQGLLQGYEDLTNLYSASFEWIITSLGFQVKKGLTVRHLAVAITAMTEGCALRDTVAPKDMRNIQRPTGTNQRREKWTLLSIGLEAISIYFLEEIPGWSPVPLDA